MIIRIKKGKDNDDVLILSTLANNAATRHYNIQLGKPLRHFQPFDEQFTA